MVEPVLTAVNLVIFAVCFTVGTAKAAAARSDRDTTLRITASVLLCASVVYLLSAPAVYRAVGTISGSPSLPSLVVSSAILLCVGHAHLLTLLWHPRRRTPDALRRQVILWAPMYGLAIAAMVVFFWTADLTGPARPLSFATSYAHVPAAFAFEMVYLAALVAGIIATVRQCRGPDGVIALPERPELSDSLRLFAVAVALDFAYVVCTAAAVITAARGSHSLDFLAAAGSVASSTSALVASYGLAKPALAAREAERADHTALLDLWETVTEATAGTERPQMTLWNRRYALSDLLAEILDGAHSLRPWMSPAPAQAVQALAETHPGGTKLALPDLKALQTAATIRYARQRRDAARQLGLPTPDDTPTAGPVEKTPPTLARARQVLIARKLSDPLVVEALDRIS
ncbi:DUF6545 domain-containing protein [Streptomyces umbrinus]|uniref:DUF6545 domain-containing protein n=1 Tax=Streptomyces umbrinus TaxID=67370 RepID=UPI003403BE67